MNYSFAKADNIIYFGGSVFPSGGNNHRELKILS